MGGRFGKYGDAKRRAQIRKQNGTVPEREAHEGDHRRTGQKALEAITP